MKNRMKKFAVMAGVALVAVVSARADTVAGLVAAQGATLAADVLTVATGALTLFAALYGIRIAIRAFKSVK